MTLVLLVAGCATEAPAPTQDTTPASSDGLTDLAVTEPCVVDAVDADTCDASTSPPSYSDWMNQLISEVDGHDLALVDICFPRAHDAGTYDLTSCTMGGIACNTQTQGLDMREMLEAGVRGFDVRPMIHDDDYLSHHTTWCNGFGCRGDTIRNMLRATREFLEAHRELVIWEIGHYCNTSSNDPELRALVAEELGETLYVEDGPPGDIPFIRRPLRDVIPPDAATGRALMLWGGVGDTADNRAVGIFAGSFMPRRGGWSNKLNLDELIEDQLARYAAFDHDGDAIFEFSWTMTMDDQLAADCLSEDHPRSIESMAAETNGALAPTLDQLIADGSIAPGRIPHVLSVDYANVFVTEQCLRLSRLGRAE